MIRLNKDALDYLIAVADDAGFELIGSSVEEFEHTHPEVSLTFRQKLTAVPDEPIFEERLPKQEPDVLAAPPADSESEKDKRTRERMITLDD